MIAMAKRVMAGGALAGLLGGAAMIALMIVVMGAMGSGYATPLNLGIPAFAKTITPPTSILPTMMMARGIHLPASAMSQLGPALASGHLSAAMMHKLSTMLMGMHLPAAEVTMIGQVMSGHASNATMATLLSGMSAAGQHAIMHAMPVTAGNVTIGAVTHFALAMILGIAFAMLIIGIGIERLALTMLRTPVAIILASVAGAAVVYVVNRWLILPAIDPMMRLVPEAWFFIAHLLFGLIVGAGTAMVAAREGLLTGRESPAFAALHTPQ